MFSASTTYEKQLRIEKTRLSHQVWSHGGSTFKKKRTLNGHFSRPAETDPYDDRYLTLAILFTPFTLVTLFQSYDQFYRAECITVSGFCLHICHPGDLGFCPVVFYICPGFFLHICPPGDYGPGCQRERIAR